MLSRKKDFLKECFLNRKGDALLSGVLPRICMCTLCLFVCVCVHACICVCVVWCVCVCVVVVVTGLRCF